jgi:tetratricopeptide (TPR) repeat protein
VSSVREILSEAVGLHRNGALDDARQGYLRVLDAEPDNADALNLLGVLELQGKRYVEAADYLERAVASKRTAEYLGNLGLAYKHAGNRGAAASQFEAALELQPDNLEAAINLAALLHEAGRTAEARELLDAHAARGARHPQYLYNLANVCIESGEFDRARGLLEDLLAIAPADAGARFNHAMLLKNAGEFDRAARDFERLVGDPNKGPKARWFLGQCRLLGGDLESGWEFFAERFDALDIDYRETGLPAWKPGAGTDDDLLVWAEQGIGDELLFATHIPALQPHCKRIRYECDARLRLLLARTYPQIEFVDRDRDPRAAAARGPVYQCAAGDLVRYTNPGFDNRLAGSVFLVVDADRAAAIEVPGPGPLRIGLSYYTGGSNAAHRMPPASLWNLFAEFEGRIGLVDLQSNARRDLAPPAALLDRGMLRQVDAIDLYDDIDGLAALISRLDHVVTIDNAVAHLAGSLGVPATLLLSTVHDWRWPSGRATVPWYPALRLLRQRRQGDWDAVAAELSGLLRGLAGESD